MMMKINQVLSSSCNRKKFVKRKLSIFSLENIINCKTVHNTTNKFNTTTHPMSNRTNDIIIINK